VRHLDLHTLDQQKQQLAKNRIEAPRLHSVAPKLPPGGNPSKESALQQVVKAALAEQTLVQPDVTKPVVVKEKTPVPTVVVWDGENSPAKKLIAPQPEKLATADVQPSLQRPNNERTLADLGIAATDLSTHPQPIQASNTTPIALHGPNQELQPVTTAAGAAQSTSAAVMSLSDQRMANGEVTLPPVNQSASSDAEGALSLGRSKDASQDGSGNAASRAGGVGEGMGSGDGSLPLDQLGTGDGQPPSTRIQLPKDGQFGAVVVGSSLEERYPETARLWGGRMTYTVYLHVGLSKSWILQYSVSLNQDASEAGSIPHIESPWPFSIVRPNLDPGAIDADALMVHGFINREGRFENLKISFPPEFEQEQFVLTALSQWQFRPATQNGEEVKVEVLLIIPEEPLQ
jgi:hypothetical protein